MPPSFVFREIRAIKFPGSGSRRAHQEPFPMRHHQKKRLIWKVSTLTGQGCSSRCNPGFFPLVVFHFFVSATRFSGLRRWTIDCSMVGKGQIYEAPFVRTRRGTSPRAPSPQTRFLDRKKVIALTVGRRCRQICEQWCPSVVRPFFSNAAHVFDFSPRDLCPFDSSRFGIISTEL